ncbi:hypothetical protein HDU76_008524 [Blyttiomyces sp. JEL0837]|nr:hypothetical protein HDU76_008524 [Blyttiomyces sp. JEL0837]
MAAIYTYSRRASKLRSESTINQRYVRDAQPTTPSTPSNILIPTLIVSCLCLLALVVIGICHTIRKNRKGGDGNDLALTSIKANNDADIQQPNNHETLLSSTTTPPITQSTHSNIQTSTTPLNEPMIRNDTTTSTASDISKLFPPEIPESNDPTTSPSTSLNGPPSPPPETLIISPTSALQSRISIFHDNISNTLTTMSNSNTGDQMTFALEIEMQRIFGQFDEWGHDIVMEWAGRRNLEKDVVDLLQELTIDGPKISSITASSLKETYGIQDFRVRAKLVQALEYLKHGNSIYHASTLLTSEQQGHGADHFDGEQLPAYE